MNKLTKAQRHKYYKEALRVIKNDEQASICITLYWLCNFQLFTHTHQCFTELMSKKPKDKGKFDYWWPKNEHGQASRIAALKRCIEETKPKQTMETKKNKR